MEASESVDGLSLPGPRPRSEQVKRVKERTTRSNEKGENLALPVFPTQAGRL